MISSFLIALREGVEAALMVGIVLVYLDRTGRSRLARYVWAGVGLAAALSLVAAIALEHWHISEDGFEGVMLLVASVFVVSMIVWMNQVARHLRKEIEQRLESFADKTDRAAGLSLGTFVFLMVLREGAELALILRAVELSTEGLAVWIGTGLGIAVAVAVGVFFFQGTLKIPLGRFFKATSAILMIVAAQLALTGIHELSEAMWLPSSKREMALVGPIVRNDVFFFVLILGGAALLVFREWLAMPRAKEAAAAPAANEAERRRVSWELRKRGRWMFAAATVFLLVILTMAADFVYGKVAAAPPQARTVTAQNGLLRIPTSEVRDGNLHFFTADSNGTSVRFIVIQKPDGSWGTSLDACMICGWAGYRQDGSNMICNNCASAIYIPSIGQSGGCNPVVLPSHVEGSDLILDLSALSAAAQKVPH